MEHNSSSINQLRTEITARVVRKKEIDILEVDTDENIEKLDKISEGTNRIKNAIRRRRQKNQHHREFFLRLKELNISKTDIKNEIDALKQIISHIEEVKEQFKFKIKQLKKKIKNLSKGKPFDFADYIEKQKEDNEIDLGLFLEVAEENKIIHNQTPVNILIEDMEKLRSGFFTNGYFSLGDQYQ